MNTGISEVANQFSNNELQAIYICPRTDDVAEVQG